MSDHTYDHIIEDFNFQKDLLEKQITNVEIRQQEIQLHISSIEAANTNLGLLIHQEQDKRKKSNYHVARLRNIEALAKLFGIYKEFEDVKFKYYSNISDMIYKSHKLIEVDIKRANSKTDTAEIGDVFKRLSEVLMVNSENNNSMKQELAMNSDIVNPEYQL